MSYFHTGTRTIIGAEAFHCPVRDGKEWDHLAMVIRRKRSPTRTVMCAGTANSQSRSHPLMVLRESNLIAAPSSSKHGTTKSLKLTDKSKL